MISIPNAVVGLETLFNSANSHFYNNELEKPVILIQTSGKRHAYGWCTVNKVWNSNEEHYYEISIAAEYLQRPIQEVFATLLHEMVHLYNAIHEIKDTTNNYSYHNKRFKIEAENRGLIIEHSAKYGWTLTTLNEEAITFLSTIPVDISSFSFSRHVQVLLPKENKYKLYNYQCPCGEKVKSLEVGEEGSHLQIRCTNCDGYFYFTPSKRGRKSR